MAQSPSKYVQLGRDARRFAAMCADFQAMSSGPFKAKYPDYDYGGTDYVARHANELAEKLQSFAAETLRRAA